MSSIEPGWFLVGVFVISFVCVALVYFLGKRHLLDRPNDRSSHETPTPRGGGLGFVLASYLGTLALAPLTGWKTELPLLLLPISVILLLVSFTDDLKSISAKHRILTHILCCALALLVLPLASTASLPAALVMAILLLVGVTLINFYNFMDGSDGLVGSVAFVQLLFLSALTGDIAFLIIAVAVGAFLCWNWAPAKIFMGDTGSTFLGFCVFVAVLRMPSIEGMASVIALTFPLTIDAFLTVIRRARNGENIFEAHRSHLYQRLIQSGFSHGFVAFIYLIATVGTGLTVLTPTPLAALFAGAWCCLIFGLLEYALDKKVRVNTP